MTTLTFYNVKVRGKHCASKQVFRAKIIQQLQYTFSWYNTGWISRDGWLYAVGYFKGVWKFGWLESYEWFDVLMVVQYAKWLDIHS